MFLDCYCLSNLTSKKTDVCWLQFLKCEGFLVLFFFVFDVTGNSLSAGSGTVFETKKSQ